MRVPELKALARERGLRNYSRLRKAELIAFLQDNAPQEPRAQRRQRPSRPSRPPLPPPQRHTAPAPWMSTWEPQQDPQTTTQPTELEEAAITKRQLKHRRNKDSKLAKKFNSLEAEIDNLRSQMGTLKNKITKASESTNAGFKRKKIRSMKREAGKISKKLAKSEAKLELIEPQVTTNPIRRVPLMGQSPGGRRPLKLRPLNRSKHIEAKIAELNKKIKRAKGKKNKECLIAKREALKGELNWRPRLLEGAFGGAYRRYRIDGMPKRDLDTFFNRIRRFLIDLLKRESRTGAVRSQAMT